ncbi:MAG: APC family permease [Acidobacteriaceae bacterium]
MSPQLDRKVGLAGATALNMIEMIGVGPFITMPLIVHAMGGPQAMIGWVFGAVFALCDGMVWAELGAMFPRAGGSYEYLKEIYGPKWGRLLAFLFVWQLSFSSPLSIASGCVGLAQYATFIWPSLDTVYASRSLTWQLPLVGGFRTEWSFGRVSLVAMCACLVAMFTCYRGIEKVATVSKLLWMGVIVTVGWVVFSGVTHFRADQAFAFPPNAFHLDHAFFTGLGSAVLIATYDYWGYYNVNFFGGEVRDPKKNIPRALLLSIVAVACIYVVMNLCVLGVVPWRDLDAAAGSGTHNFTISLMMQRLYGVLAGKVAAGLVMWTAFASIVAVMVGVSRVPYAAAQDGNYFRAFAHVHPVRSFPDMALVALGAVALLLCTLRLQDLIAALVVIRIAVQFLAQCIGVMVLRVRRPELSRPFRMWLYPFPALMAAGGFLFVLFSRTNAGKELVYASIVIVVGLFVYGSIAFGRRRAAR